MKMGGRKIQGPNTVLFVIPRTSGDLVFQAQAVLDFTVFEALCPRPKAPKMRKRGQTGEIEDPADKNFLLELDQYGTKRVNYIVIHSLKATKDLEWETVDFNNPDSWGNYEKELKEADFTPMEINYIVGKTMDVNSLNEKLLEEARDRFLAEQSVPQNGLFHAGEHMTSQSGELVNVSASGPQE